MPIYRVAMQFPYDSTLPRDVVQVTPHFFGTDPSALLNQLKSNLIAWAPVGAKPFTLKAYDAMKPPPSYPLATVSQAGTPPASGLPRELCLCLSFYATYNRPRSRGRLYLPAAWLIGAPALRPTNAAMQLVLDFASKVLLANMPDPTQWWTFSTINKDGNRVTNYWCDDEWDIQRKRGLRSTTRLQAVA